MSPITIYASPACGMSRNLLAAGLSWLLMQPVQAEESPADLEQVVLTGTRTSGLRASDSPAPIEILDRAELLRDARNDLGAVLGNLLPSLNMQALGYDLANATLAVRMRGLSPNHTLVLINGKRLHGTVNLSVLGGPYQGGAAPDFNFVAASAIDRIEVLQDGAAARYG